MRLYSFRIKNFKSIIDTGEVKLSPEDNLTILAGQNESGKSSILEALDFFEQGAEADFEETYRRLRTHPRVECTYHFDAEDLKAIDEKSGKKAAKAYLKEHGVTMVRGSVDTDDYAAIKYIYPDDLKNIFEPETEEKAEEATPEPDAFDYGKYVISIRPKFIFYSSFDGNILPNKITKADLGTSQAVEDFETVFNTDFSELLTEANDAARRQKLNNINTDASDNLNEYWTQKVDDETSDYKFSVEVFPQAAAPETSYVSFLIDQGDNHQLHFGQKSKGFQWFSSFNLRLRAHEASSDNLSSFILLIDEPGHNLHEEAQKNVKRVLNELGENGVQIIFSTHQAQLLRSDEDVDLSRIKLIARSKKDGTKIQNIAQSSSQNGFKDALAPIRTAMGLISIDVASFTNGSKPVIVEGITDSYYIQGFIKLASPKLKVNVIPCAGVSQTPNVYSILLGWGIDSAKIIVDDDSAGTKEYNKIKKNLLAGSDELSENVLFKNTGSKGIEDTFSQADFAKIASEIIDTTDTSKTNAELANGNKEIVARTFLDRVKATKAPLKLADLDATTRANIKAIVDFIAKS